MNEFSTCKECQDEFSIGDLIWADKGSFYWVCDRCYQVGAK